MPRPRRDGTPAQAPNKCKLNDLFVKRLKQQARAFVVWDSYQRGLAIVVQSTGHKAWKCVYSFHSRPRWYHIGDAAAVGLADARKLASRVMFQVAEGKDPCAERKAQRSKGTFEELATRYVEEYAKRKNRSWKQADALVRKHLLPRWGKLQAANVSRSDVKALMQSIKAPVVANQTLAAASAIFAWAIREEIATANPCQLVERNETKSRERVLSDSEIPKFWTAFDGAGLVQSTALKLILLTGQRPGEVATCVASTSLTAGGKCPAIRFRRLAGPAPRTARRIGSGCPPPCRSCSRGCRRIPDRCLMACGPTPRCARSVLRSASSAPRRTIYAGHTVPRLQRSALVATP